jgi:hypothetical protein
MDQTSYTSSAQTDAMTCLSEFLIERELIDGRGKFYLFGPEMRNKAVYQVISYRDYDNNH